MGRSKSSARTASARGLVMSRRCSFMNTRWRVYGHHYSATSNDAVTARPSRRIRRTQLGGRRTVVTLPGVDGAPSGGAPALQRRLQAQVAVSGAGCLVDVSPQAGQACEPADAHVLSLVVAQQIPRQHRRSPAVVVDVHASFSMTAPPRRRSLECALPFPACLWGRAHNDRNGPIAGARSVAGATVVAKPRARAPGASPTPSCVELGVGAGDQAAGVVAL